MPPPPPRAWYQGFDAMEPMEMLRQKHPVFQYSKAFQEAARLTPGTRTRRVAVDGGGGGVLREGQELRMRDRSMFCTVLKIIKTFEERSRLQEMEVLIRS